MKAVLVCLFAILLVGCQDAAQRYANKLNQTQGYQNARDVGRGYVMYEIERGTVTCRESAHHHELTCWKNGNE